MIRIGIICPSEIAYRRFLPALRLVKEFEFTKIAVANTEEWYGKGAIVDQKKEAARLEQERNKAQSFIDYWGGGEIVYGYESLVSSSDLFTSPSGITLQMGEISIGKREACVC